MTNYVKTANGYARNCGKCGGNGIYWTTLMTANGPTPKQDVCYPCDGTGHSAKVFATLEELQLADARNEKAREAREAKAQAEWEAKRPERELEAARLEQALLEREADDARWSHLDGEVGDKVTISGTISVATSIETQYGTSRLILIETPEFQTIKLFTSAEWSWTAELNTVVTVAGAIKSFDTYNGRPQTTLTRGKLVL